MSLASETRYSNPMERSQYLEHSTPLPHLRFCFEDAEEMRAAFAEEKQRNIYSHL